MLNLPIFYLCGPTASGKSSVALALAQQIGGEIVNADAFQLYRGLDLCTAKPSAAERAEVPHHLFDVLDANDACDAQRFRELAEPAIRDVLSRQRWPILVGGSGLYVKALTHGLANLPKGDAALRAELGQMSPEERVAELLRLDPAATSNVPLSNDRYVSRALEICRLTGQPQSQLRQQWQQNQPRFLGALLTRERDDLYQRINARVLQMVEAGVVEEVREFLESLSTAHGPTDIDPSPSPTALPSPAPRPPSLLSAIGVREIQAFLHGECSLDQAIDAMQQATRRYAKRQITWFRREQGFQTICLAPQSNPDFAT
ncbi:MAG: tRNA (adenosine(37)-N6)-dimethylallyltransferase MiaA, partial [Roseimicrobium sp.]